MPPGRAQPVVEAPAEDLDPHLAARGFQLATEQTNGGPGLLAESQDAGDAVAAGMGCQTLELGIVLVQHCRARRAHALEDLGLGVGDGLDGVEEFEMGRLDGGDDRHIGPDHAGEGPQLAGMIHAELEHAQRDVARQAREAERHAPMIVQAAFIGVGLDLGRKREAQRFLGAGLADAAGDAHQARPAARASRQTQARQRRPACRPPSAAAHRRREARAGDGPWRRPPLWPAPRR